MQLTVTGRIDGAAMAFGDALFDARVVQTAAGPVLYTLGGTGGGISAFSIAPDGALTLIDEQALALPFRPGIAPRLSVHDGAAGPALLLSGLSADAGGVQALGSDGRFAAAPGWTGAGDTLIAPVTVPVGRATYLFTGQPGGGIATLEFTAPAMLQPRAQLADTADLPLADIAAMAVVQAGGASFLLAASATEHSLTSLRIDADGGLTPVSWIGAPDGLALTGADRIEVVSAHGQDFAVVGAAGASSLTVLTVGADGALSLTDLVTDDLATRFQSVLGLATTTTGGRAYVAASGSDGGVSLFTLLPDGRLLLLDTLIDDTATSLAAPEALALYAAGGALHVVAGGGGDTGLTRASLDLSSLAAPMTGADGDDVLTGAALDDLIWGAGGDDTINGGAGADILYDGTGSDTLTGGDGADLFVFAADGTADTVTDFERGLDRFDLSAFTMLYDLSALTVTPTSNGAVLSYRDEAITVFTRDGVPLEVDDLSNADILNLSRPPTLPADQILTGGAGDDVLTGGLGDDVIDGGDGNDSLSGRDGADTIRGGLREDTILGGGGADLIFGDAGFDVVDGGPGNDVIHGGDQADTLRGGSGDDTIFGENGVDTLYGDDGNDTLRGGDGNDRLEGGDGADNLFGDIFEDRLFGGTGDDHLEGGAGFDYLDGGDGNDWLDGGNQADNLWGRAGDDTLIGGSGLDRLFGGPGNDTLLGDAGDDRLFGEGGDDVLMSGEGPDRLNGGPGNDLLDGGEGDDDLSGGAGFDTILGGPGNDLISGNFNADTFTFTDGFGTDRIRDFEALNDFERISLAGVASIEDWQDLIDNHLTIDGADIRIDTDAGDVLYLNGVDYADLDPLDFIF